MKGKTTNNLNEHSFVSESIIGVRDDGSSGLTLVTWGELFSPVKAMDTQPEPPKVKKKISGWISSLPFFGQRAG